MDFNSTNHQMNAHYCWTVTMGTPHSGTQDWYMCKPLIIARVNIMGICVIEELGVFFFCNEYFPWIRGPGVA